MSDQMPLPELSIPSTPKSPPHVGDETDAFTKLLRDLEEEHNCQLDDLRGENARLRSQLRCIPSVPGGVDRARSKESVMKGSGNDTYRGSGIGEGANRFLRTPKPTEADQWCPEPPDPDLAQDDEFQRPETSREGRRSICTTKTSPLQMEATQSSTDEHKKMIQRVRSKIENMEAESDSLHCLDAIFIVLIISNAIAMGSQVQRQAEIGRAPGWVSPTNFCFTIAFVLELVVRCVLEKADFLRGERWRWNVFDLIVVLFSVVEEFLVRIWDEGKIHGSTLRTLRLLRIIRIVRSIEVVRFVRLFRTGRMLMLSLVEAFGMMMWIIFVMLSLVFLLALTLANAALPHCEGDTREYDLLCDHFGTLFQAFSTTFQAALGGIEWGTLVDAVEVMDIIYPVLVAIFMIYIMCIFMPIIVSIFVVQVQKIGVKEDEDTFFADQWARKERIIGKMMRIFRMLDANESGTLSRDELHSVLKDKELLGLLATLELDSDGILQLFDLIDSDDSGQVSMQDFIEGCLRFQGKARAVTMEKVERKIMHIAQIMTEINRKMGSMGDGLKNDFAVTCEPDDDQLDTQRSSTMSGYDRRLSSTTNFVASAACAHIRVSRRACIEQPEMRAMRLGELENVADMITLSCRADAWDDMLSGERLKPEETNLYHFNYHCICPKTAGPTLLTGLAEREYLPGQSLVQMHPTNGSVIAIGEVHEDTRGNEVVITLLKGKFEAAPPGTSLNISVFMDGEDCGTPSKVSVANALPSWSFKEALSSEPTKPDWFCCHWWGEPVLHFVKCCKMHSDKRKKYCYWICGYACRQHELDTEIGDDPENTAFRRAMKLSDGTLLVLDPEATPFERVWCAYELFKTLSELGEVLFDIVTLEGGKPQLLTEKPLPGEPAAGKANRESTFPLRLLATGIQVTLENGIASVESDKVNILHSMAKHPSTGERSEETLQKNVDLANKTLRGHLAVAAWPQALKRGIVEDFAREHSETRLGLPEVLAADIGRMSLSLSFASIQEVTDSEMALIAQGLPPALIRLDLSFDSCLNVSDLGISALAQRLTSLSLQHLSLDFQGCREVTDTGVTYLANELPSTLIELRLIFAFCPKVSRIGVAAISKRIPANLKKFKATFKGTKCDMVFDSVRALKKVGQARPSVW